MIIINGKRFKTNIIEMLDDTIVSKASSKLPKCDVSITKSELGAKKVFVCGNVNKIKIGSKNSPSFSIHLSGNLDKHTDVLMTVKVFNGEINVFVECQEGNNLLVLEMVLPSSIENLFLQSDTSNIDISSSVNVKLLHINNKTGTIDSRASLDDLYIDSDSGEIFADIHLKSNTHISIYTKSGNISIHIFNAISTNLLAYTNSSLKESQKLEGKYLIYGSVTSQTGNIKIR